MECAVALSTASHIADLSAYERAWNSYFDRLRFPLKLSWLTYGCDDMTSLEIELFHKDIIDRIQNYFLGTTGGYEPDPAQFPLVADEDWTAPTGPKDTVAQCWDCVKYLNVEEGK
jgi:hypothetical protein